MSIMQYRVNRRMIDLSAIRDNVAAVKNALPAETQLMAVVKADAYGHGAVQVAREALASGATWLGVAIPEEGRQLRNGGITAPILVLGAATPTTALGAAQWGLTQTICSTDMVEWAEAAGKEAGCKVAVHLKLDTGMSRIGARTTEEVKAILAALAKAPHVQLTGAFTHFADADGDTPSFTLAQYKRFQALTKPLPANLIFHCANSAAIHRWDFAWQGMVRLGISMYGCPPVKTNLPLRPVMAWETEVTYVKEISVGDTVSYGRTFQADKPMRIATIPVGYGDGYHRAASAKGQVLIEGKRGKVLGRVCMDQIMVDVTHIPQAKAGSSVMLLGRQGTEEITGEELAGWAGTISYEVLLAATNRVERVFINASV